MFTGIIEELGVVENIIKKGKSLRLVIKAKEILEGIRIGESIAVNGVCLTVVKIEKDLVYFDCIEETLRLTNLGRLKLNERVNLEKPLKVDSLLSGHIILGHIDGMGRIVNKVNKGEQVDLYIEADKEILAYFLPKGSIALDGVSLTLVDVGKDNFSVSLIPYTLKMTTLGFKVVGDFVNIEVDILAKYIKKFFLHQEPTKKKFLTEEFLREHGFL